MNLSSLMPETPVRGIHTGGLRVAIVTNYPSDPGRIVGGVQAVSARLVEALARVPGLELHVIHCHSDITESRVVERGPVTLHFIAQTRRRVIPNMITGIGLIGRRLHDIAPDVVHAHGPHLAVAALRAGYQPLWTIHGVLREEAPHFPGLFHRLSFALAQYYERQALGRVRIITTVSPYVVEAYRGTSPSGGGRSRARWEVIENPADVACFELPRRPVRGRVLVPGALIPRKDPLTLVQAAALVRRAVPELSLHLAGSLSNAAYVAELRDEIGRSGLTETVRLLGPLPTDRLLEEFSQAEVVALASRQESAPMAVIEALAAGVPVVATAAGGVPYLVEDGVTGRVVPQADPAALAEALIEVLSQPAETARMGAAGRAAAQSRFRPELVAGQYLALYREIALSASRPEGFPEPFGSNR